MFKLKRKPKPYVAERERILQHLSTINPSTEAYAAGMQRLDEIDRILNRTSELKKTFIPAAGGVVTVGGIYMLQQFAGVIVPKALDSYATHKEQKKHKDQD